MITHFTVTLPVVIALAAIFVIVAPRIGDKDAKFTPVLLTIVLVSVAVVVLVGFH